MHYKVEIETRQQCGGGAPIFAARVVKGPGWLKGSYVCSEGGPEQAATKLRHYVAMIRYPQHSFDFVHTPA